MSCEDLAEQTSNVNTINIIVGISIDTGKKKIIWLVKEKTNHVFTINIDQQETKTQGTCNVFRNALLLSKVIVEDDLNESIFVPERWRKYNNQGDEKQLVYVFLMTNKNDQFRLMNNFAFSENPVSNLLLVQKTIDKMKKSDWWKPVLVAGGVALTLAVIVALLSNNRQKKYSGTRESLDTF